MITKEMNIDLLPKVKMTFDCLREVADPVFYNTITPSYSWKVQRVTEEIDPEYGAFLCNTYEETNHNLGIKKKEYLNAMCEEVEADETRSALIRIGLNKLMRNNRKNWEDFQ